MKIDMNKLHATHIYREFNNGYINNTLTGTYLHANREIHLLPYIHTHTDAYTYTIIRTYIQSYIFRNVRGCVGTYM